MILRRAAAVTALAVALSWVSPARAQEVDTSASDLRCAVWSAMVLGANDNEEVVGAFSMALVWFLARYEAATGTRYEQTATPEYVRSLEPDIEAIELECQPRMHEMGLRLEGWGKTLEESGL